MTVTPLLDSAGRRRSPATLPGYHAGRPPRNKGQQYPADPPTIEEIVAVMRQAGDDRHGSRVRALIAMLWRGGLRVQEALSLAEQDLDQRRGSLLVRRGKGGRRREIGMDTWGWEQHRRNHRHRPRPASSHDVRHRRTPALRRQRAGARQRAPARPCFTQAEATASHPLAPRPRPKRGRPEFGQLGPLDCPFAAAPASGALTVISEWRARR
jgi:integrase